MGTPELPVPAGLVLRPFRGVRFAVEDPAKVTSPPYDLISDADVEVLLDSHPNNVVRLILPCSSRSNSSPGTPTDDGHPSAPPAAPSEPGPSQTASPQAPPSEAESPQAALPQAAPSQAAPPQFRPDAASPTGETPLQPRYAVARDTLRDWLNAGVLVPDDVPALYVYEQSGPDVLQRGLIGDVGLADPSQRIILPHEDVFPGPIADRLALMSTTQANLEPIFLLYDGDNGTATRLVDEVVSERRPLVSARTEDGLTHRLWAITAPEEIAAINADLHHRQALIADGHHRYATYRVLQRQERAARHIPHPTSTSDTHSGQPPVTGGSAAPPAAPGEAGVSEHAGTGTADPAYDEAALSPWDFGLALLVDSRAYPPDLKAIHRVIQGLPLDEAVSRAKSSWQVHDYEDLAAGLAALERAPEPAFLLAGEQGSHLLTDPDPVQLSRAMPPDRSDRWNSLNTSVLAEFVLPVVWGMRDNDQTVHIVHHDTDAAVSLAIRTGGTAVILKPLVVDDVLAIAAGGERVPRKSTSFGPKPRTGLVLRTFAID
ncbi:DUF1015 family protein [Nonomuraea sp. GTA35]|uniref:DUF1015 family protein n=1 Tax=Nonomuraea sp. GTA35 TaxID=1676746 RepID=UPI0035BF8A96